MLISLALTGASVIWKIEKQREKEAELLFIGQQYTEAIASYYHASPGGAKKYPRTIDELLRDPRYVTVKRHLRQPWRDPLTGLNNWGIIYTKQGGIAGIYSNALGTPLKQAGFGVLDSMLAGKSSYYDWKFIYIAAADDTLRQAKESQDAEGADSDLENEKQNKEQASDGTGEDEEPQEEETGAELLPDSDLYQ